ncbi:Transcription factor domain, fungi [Phaffia rhodozyma]|uniref:Transcription factor domain, fungi n=1 Tax=Phaffia rhodozyma TaxID=264483 RepID=A0A0F7SKZ4_PHARH|nr:Transcription factor domain, fungi [Phaffia rhodozyma]
MDLSVRPVLSELFPVESIATVTTTAMATSTYTHPPTRPSSSVFQSTTGSPCSSPSAPLSSSGLSSPGTITPSIRSGPQDQTERKTHSIRSSSSSSSSSPAAAAPSSSLPAALVSSVVHPDPTAATAATTIATSTDHLSALDVLLSAAEELSSASDRSSGSSADGSSPPSALTGSTARQEPPSLSALPTASALGATVPAAQNSSSSSSLTRTSTAHTSTVMATHSRSNPTEAKLNGSVVDSVPTAFLEEPGEAEELTTKGKKRKRLAKACSTSPSLFSLTPALATRECIYLSSSGQPVPAPRANRPRSGSAVSITSSNGRHSPDLLVSNSVPIPPTSVSASVSSKQNIAKRSKIVVAVAPVEQPLGSIPPSVKPSPLSMGTSLLGEGFYSRPAASGTGFAAGAGGSSNLKNVPLMGKPLYLSTPALSNGSLTNSNNTMIKKHQSNNVIPSGRSALIPIHSSPQPSILTAVPAVLRRSLIQTFFQTVGEPICSIFHRPSFDHAFYNDNLHPVLTLAIYAFAARFSSHPFFRSRQAGGTGTEQRERSTKGDIFAKEVDAFFNTNDPSAWDTEDREEELAQGLALMVVYESLMRRGKSMVFYMDILIPYITRLTNPDRISSDQSSSGMSRRAITRRETRSRIFWFSYSLTCFLDAQVWTVRPAGRFTEEACSLALPVDDASFDLGIEPSSPRVGLRGGDLEGTPISELGYLARVAEIFQKTVSTPLSPASSSSIQDQEASLAAWAQSLPPGLQFNKANLEAAGRKIKDGTWAVEEGEQSENGGSTGHLFAGIHMAAEVAMFFHLQAVKKSSSGIDTPKEEFLSRRQAQAIENIVFLLEAVGEKGRRNPSCFFPLYIASKWRSQILASDERLAALWKENYQVWGFDSGLAFVSTSRKSQSDVSSSTTLAGSGLVSSSAMRGVTSLNGFSSRVPPFLSSSSSSSASSSVAAVSAKPPLPTTTVVTTTTNNSLSGNSHAPRRATFSAGDYPRLPSIQSLTCSSSSLTISPSPSSGLPALTVGNGRTPDPFLISPRTYQGLFPGPPARRPSIPSPTLTK